ncbi:unnamed protein product [Pseudo-nitzschia multistriata]|uniref:Uncharacterized protein n=1 Tax=Pseudo-nitzschia multistriata TaxID=183589 RepID=A0A448ZSM2_9STRA|nr:unnamed protein product [Pseudo-nitzschia multistriata]
MDALVAEEKAATSEEKVANNKEKKKIATCREYGGDSSHLIYKSGIPTLRASAHRVKARKKNRKHDPKPLDRDGNETGTTWLPEEVQEEKIFSYNVEQYDIVGAVKGLLRDCDPEIVGSFETTTLEGEKSSEFEKSGTRLEDFRVAVSSVWRTK